MQRSGERGAVYVEFLLVFPPLFVFFLCIIQLALLYSAHLGVQHAASISARAAVVVFPDDPHYYNDSPKNELTDVSNCGESPTSILTSFAGSVAGSSSGGASLPLDNCKGGPRANAIRSAAVLAMIPYAPNADAVFPDWASDWLSGQVGGVLGAGIYNLGAVGVTFPTAPNKNSYFEAPHKFAEGDKITVRVTYLAHCGIPVARFLMCDTFTSLLTGVDLDARKRDDFMDVLRAQRRVKDSKPGAKELLDGVSVPVLLLSWITSGQRFRIIRSEMTLPLQYAPYDYQSEGWL